MARYCADCRDRLTKDNYGGRWEGGLPAGRVYLCEDCYADRELDELMPYSEPARAPKGRGGCAILLLGLAIPALAAWLA